MLMRCFSSSSTRRSVLDRPVDEIPGARQRLHQCVAVDRLFEKAESPGPQPALLLVVDGDDVDRHVAGARIVLEQIEQRPAIHVRQADIEGDRVRLVAVGERQRRRAVAGDQTLEALLARKLEQNRGEHRVILDDEHDAIAGRDRVAVVGEADSAHRAGGRRRRARVPPSDAGDAPHRDLVAGPAASSGRKSVKVVPLPAALARRSRRRAGARSRG